MPDQDSTGTADAAIAEAVDDPNIRTFGLLLESHANLERVLDERLRADTDLTLQTLEVLLRIARSPDGWIPVSRLGPTLALTSGGVTRLVDRIEAAGLLHRQRCDQDGRVVELRLTDAGTQQLAVALGAHRTHLDEEVAAPLRTAGVDVRELEAGLDALRSTDGRPC